MRINSKDPDVNGETQTTEAKFRYFLVIIELGNEDLCAV